MAKMFYTLEEAAQRLGQSESQVKQMVDSGQLQEFRDRDRIMLKRDQVDLLAGDGGDDAGLGSGVDLEPLSLASSGLGASGTGISLAGESGASSGPKESSGISIFDDDLESADANDQTQVTASRNVEFADKGSSAGSGLLEAAREADDTSLGADILGNVYGEQQETMSATATDAGGGALFETTGAEIADTPAMAPMMQMEAFDGKGSGLAGGLALGMVLTLALAIAVAVFSITGMSGGLLETITGNFWAVVGGLGGFTLIAGVIGMVVGGKS